MRTQSKTLVRAVQFGDVERVRQLLEKRQDLNLPLPDKDGFTLIHWSVQEWNPEITRLLVEYGANPNTSGDSGVTPLANATGDNKIEAVELLLELGADVNYSEGHGTALHTACAYEYPQVAEILIKHGADVNAVGDEGWTPLFHAAEAWNAEMIQLLLSHGARRDARDHEGRTASDVARRSLDEATRKAEAALTALE
jgi:ankyrin repeat protein